MAAWSYFAAVEKRGFIALPHSTAAWVEANAHPVTVIFTLISTLFAACSSFLFPWGVCQSIAPCKCKWSTMSIALVILTGVQTSGFVLHYGGLIVPHLTKLVRLANTSAN
ncbi:hypothetical protein B0H19DRAFT_1260408 [Mycena capillaripes]|nr:hypothetical protein B0H19DRAFT_1260408 [Mycena capillaripes]